MNSSGNQCRECGAAIPADGPGAFCAQCLLGLGLGESQRSEVGGQRSEVPLVVGGGQPPSPKQKPGDWIGRYRLVRELGYGGCGVVYLAEQEEPVRRQVALKVIKLGMDTRQVVARFEAERQALALMEHANIAKVLDAGTTETGRPYFVMELVSGAKITEYCEQNQLTTCQRLDLFTQVCHAVQHAHQKGVIHRDIKPSNVLVATQDGAPVPKVIDFGIAKATQGRLTDQTAFTAFEQFLGTPAYMSPEQAQLGGVDVDTRSDIYSLGVLLYELLTGKTPFDAKELLAAGLDAMRRTIQEQEPPTPSTRLKLAFVGDNPARRERPPAADAPSTEARDSSRRLLQAKDLIRQLRGDLDWIVMKCLEKDRARRYETANGLATDIARHLNHEPVVASPPSGLYRFQKLVRRNRVAFAAAGATTFALVAGLEISTWSLVKERQARQHAVAAEKKALEEAARSEQVGTYLKGILNEVSPFVAVGRDRATLAHILDRTAQRLTNHLASQPAVEAEVRYTLGNAYFDLREVGKAEAMHRKALAIREQLGGSNELAVAESLSGLAAVLGVQEGTAQEAERLYRAALSIRRRLHGSNDLEVAKLLNGLGLVLSGAGRYGVATVFVGGGRDAESEAAHQEAMRIQRARLPGDDPELAYSLSGLAFALEMQGKVAEAESMLRKALEIRKQAFGEENVLVANTLTDLGWFMKRHGRYREEGDFFRQALVTRRKLLGNEHPMLAADIAQLADAFVNQGNLAEAEVLWRNLVSRHGQGAWAGNAGFAVQYLLATFRTQERHAEAETFLEDEFEHGGRAELNSIAWFLGTAWSADPRDASNAVRFAEKAVAQTARKDPYDLDTLAVALAAAGDFVKAVSVEKEAIALARDDGLRAQLESHLRLYEMSFAPSRVRALKREGRLEEATALLDQAIEHFTPSSLNNLAWALATHSEPLGRDGPTAIRFAERAVAATKRKEARYLDTLAAAFAETGDFASAVAVQKEAIAAQPGPPRPDFQLRLEMYETNAPWRQIVLILEE